MQSARGVVTSSLKGSRAWNNQGAIPKLPGPGAGAAGAAHRPAAVRALAFVFKGPPGTGKTTVARKMASPFYDMGLLSAPEMVECSVAQLVGADMGVESTFEHTLGKLLFAD